MIVDKLFDENAMEDWLRTGRHFWLGSRGEQGISRGSWGSMFRDCKLRGA